MGFIKGMDLCAGFFCDVAKPLLDRHYPLLEYSVGLLGYGSDVLGYDDEISADHMWGPRFYLFLKVQDIHRKNDIMDLFSSEFPYVYKGYSVNFASPDDAGIRCPELITDGIVSPLVYIHTIEEYLTDYLGTANLENLTELDWLSFSEHRLLALTSGKLFHDGLGIASTLRTLRNYPEDVRLYLIACNWSLIAEEQAFMRRCYDVADRIGSSLVCGRIIDRLMRLVFLYGKQYAPFSKWFGTAFMQLPVSENIKQAISEVITTTNIDEREQHLVKAQLLVAELHNSSGITEPVEVHIESYYNRQIKVIFADKIVHAVLLKLAGTAFEKYPLIGTLSQVPNFTNAFDDPQRRASIKALYTG